MKKRIIFYIFIFIVTGVMSGLYYFTRGGTQITNPNNNAGNTTITPTANLSNQESDLPPVIITPTTIELSTELNREENNDNVFTAALFSGNRGHIGSTSQQTYIPESLKPGQNTLIYVKIYNTGTTNWTSAGKYSLGTLEPWDNTIWGGNRFPIPESHKGSQRDLLLNITAPTKPGNYTFKIGLIQEYVQWFGKPLASYVIRVGATRCNKTGDYCAEFVTSTIATNYNNGDTKKVTVTFKNVGKVAWQGNERIGVALVYPIGLPKEPISDSYTLIPFDETIQPGSSETFSFDTKITSSSESSSDIQFRMFTQKDGPYIGSGLFGDYSPLYSVNINKGATPSATITATPSPTVTATPSLTPTNTSVPPSSFTLVTRCTAGKPQIIVTYPVNNSYDDPVQPEYDIRMSTNPDIAAGSLDDHDYQTVEGWENNSVTFAPSSPLPSYVKTYGSWVGSLYTITAGTKYYFYVHYKKNFSTPPAVRSGDITAPAC